MSRHEILQRQDLAPKPKIVFLDELDAAAGSLVRSAGALGALFIFKRAAPSVEKAAWFQEAVAGGCLRRFSPQAFTDSRAYWQADDVAWETNERVYAALKRRGHVPAAPLIELCRDESAEAAFKKSLILRLADYYQTVAALKLLAHEGLPVEFHPSPAWAEACRWLGIGGAPGPALEGIVIRDPRSLRPWSRKSWMWWAACLAVLPLWVLLSVRRIAKAGSPEPALCAIRVYTTDYGVRGEDTLQVDWLLDGRSLHRGNTLFVIEKPVPAEYRAELARRGYRVADVSGRNAFRSVTGHFLVHELLSRCLAGWFKLVLASWRTPAAFIEVAARSWLEDVRWAAFLERWRPQHYVVYNHFHFEHLCRNARLRSAGCSSWYYVNSNQDRGVRGPIISIASQFAYLSYDHQVHWGKRDAEAYRRIGNSGRYHVFGPLWSGHVRPLASLSGLVNEKRAAGLVGPVLAVFDTSFGPAHLMGDEDVREFFESLMALLDQPAWSRSLLLYKPKNEMEVLRKMLAPEALQSLARFTQHPRCVTLKESLRPEVVIAEADLTVSIAFTAPSIVAQGAHRRALYFDPLGRFPESYYTRFPNMVAQSRADLIRLSEHWLSMPEVEFKKYLDEYMAPEFGGHMDALAVTRFRSALAVPPPERRSP